MIDINIFLKKCVNTIMKKKPMEFVQFAIHTKIAGIINSLTSHLMDIIMVGITKNVYISSPQKRFKKIYI